jgi:hypothetical protein
VAPFGTGEIEPIRTGFSSVTGTSLNDTIERWVPELFCTAMIPGSEYFVLSSIEQLPKIKTIILRMTKDSNAFIDTRSVLEKLFAIQLVPFRFARHFHLLQFVFFHF